MVNSYKGAIVMADESPARLCAKCGTLYHTQIEWDLHQRRECKVHSLEDSLTLDEARGHSVFHAQQLVNLPEYMEKRWQDIERMTDKMIEGSQDSYLVESREIIRRFRNAKTMEEKIRARDELANIVNKYRRKPR